MSARPASSRRDMAALCEVAVTAMAVFADTMASRCQVVLRPLTVRPEDNFHASRRL